MYVGSRSGEGRTVCGNDLLNIHKLSSYGRVQGPENQLAVRPVGNGEADDKRWAHGPRLQGKLQLTSFLHTHTQMGLVT